MIARAVWCGVPCSEAMFEIRVRTRWLGRDIDVLLEINAYELAVGEEAVLVSFDECLDKLLTSEDIRSLVHVLH